MSVKLKRMSTAEAIVDHFKDEISTGRLGPGQKLPSERQLQESLGVSRLALREGLARLCALGIIRVEHGRGAFVQERVDGETLGSALVPLFPERDAKSLGDLVEARSLIEGEMAARAARRRTKEDVRALTRMLDEGLASVRDDASLAELDYAFHREIARIADNAFLGLMLEALSGHIRSFLTEYARAHKSRAEALERHRPILKAIADRNAEKAREAARKHVDACRSSLEKYVKRRKTKAGRS